MNNRVLNGILAGIPAFGYLLYVTGRSYSDAYYSTIGIPNGIVNFDFWDYIYFGARDFKFLISLAFAVMFARFVLYLTESTQEYYDDHYPRLQYGFIIFYFVWYVVTLLVLIAYTWLDPTLKTDLVYSLTAIMLCVATSGFSIMILLDKKLLVRIKDGRVISQVFPWLIALVLIFFPHTFADAWGRFEGMMAKDSQPLVELYAPYQVIDDIEWEPTSNNSCRTVDDLRLLFSNQQYLIVEAVTDGHSLYVVAIDDILSIKIVGSEK